MPVTFVFTSFVTSKLKNYLPYANVALSMQEQLIWMVDYLVDHPTNHITMVVPFTATAAWLWQIIKPYPREPLWKWLGKDSL
jgi:hypothetical protein